MRWTSSRNSPTLLAGRGRTVIRSKHLSKYVLCVFESFRHLFIARINSLRESICFSLAFLVYICHHFSFRAENDLCVILKIHLNNFVRKSKHHSVLCSHPLFHINNLTDFPSCACWNRLLSSILLEKLIFLFHWSDHWFLAISL